MAEALVIHRTPEEIHSFLTGLKYPLHEGLVKNLALYMEPNRLYVPRGRTLMDQPVSLLNLGEPGKYWYGPMYWGLRPKNSSECQASVPDHSLENMLWGRIFRKQRCLILCTGFWTKAHGKVYRTKFKDERLMTLAAIHDRDMEEGNDAFALANVGPSRGLAKLGFNSMPAILSGKEGYRWLRPNSDSLSLLSTLHPFEDPEVSTELMGGEEMLPRQVA